jgi:hypothetical protein
MKGTIDWLQEEQTNCRTVGLTACGNSVNEETDGFHDSTWGWVID